LLAVAAEALSVVLDGVAARDLGKIRRDLLAQISGDVRISAHESLERKEIIFDAIIITR